MILLSCLVVPSPALLAVAGRVLFEICLAVVADCEDATEGEELFELGGESAMHVDGSKRHEMILELRVMIGVR